NRTGTAINLREIMAEVGIDAARYVLTRRNTHTHFDFDMELAKENSAENPEYYPPYAHARISTILKQPGEQGIKPSENADLSVITNNKAI
ncbi:arginine--tRNA ligase, partial [Staphylococcus condimenti]